LFVSISWLMSCEKAFTTIIDVDIPHTPHLVLGCEQNPFLANTKAKLSASKGVTVAGSIQDVYNGDMKLFENNNFIGTLVYMPDSDFYILPFINYVVGSTYKITASNPNYAIISAEDKMPSKPIIQSTSITRRSKKLKQDFDQDAWYDEVKITMMDNASTSDYYSFNFVNQIEQLNSFNKNFEPKYSLDNDFDTESEIFDIGGSQGFYFSKMYMKDANFNGKQKSITIYLRSIKGLDSLRPWFIQVENLSETGYKYEKTKTLYQNNNGNPFSEPVQVFNNVVGGNGIFRLTNAVIDTIK
jgi:hypothetical protein